MKNFIWIAVFFTVGYATPIPQDGDNQCLSKPTLVKLKDELVLAVRKKDFVKAEEITVKIDQIENEANDLKNEGVIYGQSETPLIMDVTEGTDVTLKCRFQPELSQRASQLFWIRTNRDGHDNVAIGEIPYQTNYMVEHKPKEGKYDLRINKANYDRDNGRFECRMKEGGTGNELHSKTIDLTVLLTPSEPTISPSDPIATEGRQMNLTCQSIGGSPPPEVLWYTKEQSQALEANLIEGQNKDEPTQSVLTIIPRKEDDGSAYRCTVYNRALGAKKKLETSTKIFVNYFARVNVGPENPLRVEKDETAQLECGVDAKPTVNSVKWARNGRFIDTHFKHTIPRVTLQDSGTYVCSADNGLGQIGKSELKLDVLYGPVVSLQPAKRDFNEGDNIKVDCRVDANPRPSTIQWFKEGDERFVQNGPTLRLNGVTAVNNGRYICSATNHLQPTGKGKLTRTGNATIDVNIKHKPGSIMIVGGWNSEGDAQIVNLSNETSACNKFPDYPIAMIGATGAIVDGHPIICGGDSGGLSETIAHTECYHYSEATNSWSFLTNMSTKRYYSASVPVNGKLLVLGGRDGDNRLATSEYVSPDGDASQPGPDLPGPRSRHCAVKLAKGQVMLLGGLPDWKSVIIFHPDTETFDQSLPPLTFDRERFGCAAFKSPLHDNREVVLAVGGSSEATAEVLDYTQPNPAWTEIAGLPTDYDGTFPGASVVTSASGKGAIVQYQKHFYELTCEVSGCNWRILPNQLSPGVRQAVMMTLPFKYNAC